MRKVGNLESVAIRWFVAGAGCCVPVATVSASILSWNNYADLVDFVDPLPGKAMHTSDLVTVYVYGDEFIAEDLTIENTAGNVRQVLALYAESPRGGASATCACLATRTRRAHMKSACCMSRTARLKARWISSSARPWRCLMAARSCPRANRTGGSRPSRRKCGDLAACSGACCSVAKARVQLTWTGLGGRSRARCSCSPTGPAHRAGRLAQLGQARCRPYHLLR